MMSLKNLFESSNLDNVRSEVVPSAFRLTKSIKTSTTSCQRPDLSSIPATLLKTPPRGEEISILLAFNLARIAWDALNKEDLEDLERIDSMLTTHGKISSNYLAELVHKILIKISDENRINDKLKRIHKVNKRAIILVANQLLSMYSEHKRKTMPQPVVIKPKIKTLEQLRSVMSARCIGVKSLDNEQRTFNSASVNRYRSTKDQSAIIRAANSLLLNRKLAPNKSFMSPAPEVVKPSTQILTQANIKIKRPAKDNKALITSKKLQACEEIRLNFIEKAKNKSIGCKEVKERIRDLIDEAKKLGLGEIKFSKSIYANDRAKLALLERQIKGKIRLKRIESEITSDLKLSSQQSIILK